MASEFSRVKDMSSLSGKDFERLIADLLRSRGFQIEYSSAGADGGIDILAKLPSGLASGLFVIQCKKYSSKVGVQPVRDLLGVVSSKKANKGILITNSQFTQEAKNFASGNPLQLIDGTELSALLDTEALAAEPKEEACGDSFFTQASVLRARLMQRTFRDLRSDIEAQQIDLAREFKFDRTLYLDGLEKQTAFVQDHLDGLITHRPTLNRLLEYIPSVTEPTELSRALGLARRSLKKLMKLQEAAHNSEGTGHRWFAELKPHLVRLYDILFRTYSMFLEQVSTELEKLISSQGVSPLPVDNSGAYLVLEMDWDEFNVAVESFGEMLARNQR